MSDDASNADDNCRPSFDREKSDASRFSDSDLLVRLANRRCRYVVEYFTDSSVRVADIDALVDEVILREESESTPTQRRHVAISLHHNHLPKLADMGVVSYDARSRTVRYRDDHRIESYVSLYDELDL